MLAHEPLQIHGAQCFQMRYEPQYHCALQHNSERVLECARIVFNSAWACQHTCRESLPAVFVMLTTQTRVSLRVTMRNSSLNSINTYRYFLHATSCWQ
mmetsp:Transcript_142013/g.258064  ORF Transcript_142013/g.258064 Transcript_142013/m.258064 type:complete len:98 (+) Transcript_142013:33-326(+)